MENKRKYPLGKLIKYCMFKPVCQIDQTYKCKKLYFALGYCKQRQIFIFRQDKCSKETEKNVLWIIRG